MRSAVLIGLVVTLQLLVLGAGEPDDGLEIEDEDDDPEQNIHVDAPPDLHFRRHDFEPEIVLQSNDFSGTIKKRDILLLTRNISTELNRLFEDLTKFEEFQKNLRNESQKLEYIFPGESTIIREIGKVISQFLNNSQQAVERIQRAAQSGISSHTWDNHASPNSPYYQYFDGTVEPISRNGINLTLAFNPDFGVACNETHSVISVTLDVYKYTSNVLNFARATRNLDEVFRQNMRETSYIGWQYFGSKYGAMRTFPGLSESSPIDCRYRPWYVDGSTYPRYLLIMFDSSGSMYGFPIKLARIVAEKIIQSLSEHDFVNIIMYNDTNIDQPSTCFKGLVRATPEVKIRFIELIKGAQAYGPDHIEQTMKWAIGFLKNNSHNADNCYSNLVILTDSTRKINPKLIKKLDPENEINILTFSFDNTLRQYEDFKDISCESRGFFEKVKNLGDYQTTVLQFTEFFQQSRRSDTEGLHAKPMWSNVYFDQAGLGYVITTTLPVTAKQTISDDKHDVATADAHVFVGVVGVDVFISQLNKLVLDFFSNGDYVIITNNYGNVILHPNAHRPPSKKLRSSFLPTLLLSDVEHSVNASKISELSKAMIDRAEGQINANSLFYLQSMAKGEETLLNTTYYHGPIPNTPFSFAIASRHKLGFPDINTEAARDVLDNTTKVNTLQDVIKNLHLHGYLVIKSRYGCSINDLANDKYFVKTETQDSRWFCLFEKADYCAPNQCVKRHFQNMMYDLYKIYANVILQRSKCTDPRVTSCFVITGSGMYISSRKDWFKTKTPESGQEALELKTKNQHFTEDLLVSRPGVLGDRKDNDLYVNITKSVTSTSKGTEIFLANIGVEVRLEAIKEIVNRHPYDILLLDENMLIISGFRSHNGTTDGHPLKNFYPVLANELQHEHVYSAFSYHECLHECRVAAEPDPVCEVSDPDERYGYYCRNLPRTKLELCCKQFSTYSRDTFSYPIHVPLGLSIEHELDYECVERCKEGCSEGECVLEDCPGNTQDCLKKISSNCTKEYAVMDISNTNVLAVIDISPDCTTILPVEIEEKVVVYNHSICNHVQNDYFKPFKKCFPITRDYDNQSSEHEMCLSKSSKHSKSTKVKSYLTDVLLLLIVLTVLI